MSKLFKSTRTMEAHFYLDYMGHECSRDELVAENREGWAIVMFYLGGGYCPLAVAVGTASMHVHTDVSSAAGVLREWLESERPGELEQDNYGGLVLPEELIVQVVPPEVKE